MRPVGSDTEAAFDVRLVAATNRDLEAMVEQRGSARTSTTGSTSSTCRCRRCARAPATCCCSRSTSSITSRGCSTRDVRGLIARRGRAAAALRVARQRARAAQRDRARGRDVRRCRDLASRTSPSGSATTAAGRRARAADRRASSSPSKRSSAATSCACSTPGRATSSPRRTCSASIARRSTASSCATAWSASHDARRRAELRSPPAVAGARRARDRGRAVDRRCSASTSWSITTPPTHTAGARRQLAALGRARRRSALPGLPAVDREPRRPIRSRRSPSRSTPTRARTIRSRPSVGEGDEWTRLQGLLAHLRHEQPLPTQRLVGDADRRRSRRRSRASSRSTRARRASNARAITRRPPQRARDRRGRRRDHARARRARRGRAGPRARAASARCCAAAPRDARRAQPRARGVRRADLARSQGPAVARSAATPICCRCTSRPRCASRRCGSARAVERMTGDHRRSARAQRPRQAGGRRASAVTPVVLEVVDELRGDARAMPRSSVELGDFTTACSANVLGQVAAQPRDERGEVSLARRAGSCAHRGASATATRIAIAITDNGIGMDAETAAHAFEPLYRAPARRRPATASASRSSSARSRRSAASVALDVEARRGHVRYIDVPAAAMTTARRQPKERAPIARGSGPPWLRMGSRCSRRMYFFSLIKRPAADQAAASGRVLHRVRRACSPTRTCTRPSSGSRRGRATRKRWEPLDPRAYFPIEADDKESRFQRVRVLLPARAHGDGRARRLDQSASCRRRRRGPGTDRRHPALKWTAPLPLDRRSGRALRLPPARAVPAPSARTSSTRGEPAKVAMRS